MIFAYDTELGLVAAAALVNTAARGAELLPDPAALDAFLTEQQWSGARAGGQQELTEVKALRPLLRRFWELDETGAVDLVNRLLRDADALPQLVRHDHWDWHLHASQSDAPLATRMAVEAAMAMVDVIRTGEMSRLRLCSADDCDAVVVDLSKNRSKRYCDVGNCGNRAHVAAYRERRRSGRSGRITA